MTLMAFDRASIRAKDADGRLHIGLNPISKANICEYLGAEIPNHAALGLNPSRRYRLWRHPDELAKAVATFNNLPVLAAHIPVSAEAPATEQIIGTTGTDAAFDGTYLVNTLAFWDQKAIDLIEGDRARQLSSAYRYTADMTPGVTDEGLQYDGIMRDIGGNHVALVPEGRAGPDVIVGDSKPEKRAVLMSKTAVRMQGALVALLHPVMAQDAKPNVAPLLAGVTARNYPSKRAEILAGVAALASDSNVEEVGEVLDKIAETEKTVVECELEEEAQASDADHTKLLAFLEGKLSPEDMATLQGMLGGEAQDGNMEPNEADGDPKNAMDAAISAAVQGVTARLTALGVAREEVRPLVGSVSMALDSAEAVYKTALVAKGFDLSDTPPAAYRSLVKHALKSAKAPASQAIAQDTAKTLTGLEAELGFTLPPVPRSF